MNKIAKTAFGLAAIFAAGAIVGALYAPDKGERTRRRIIRKGRGIYQSASDAFEEGRDSLEEIRDALKDNLERINDEIEQLSKISAA